MNSQFFFPAVPGQSPEGDGYFGVFGGKFISSVPRSRDVLCPTRFARPTGGPSTSSTSAPRVCRAADMPAVTAGSTASAC